MATAPYGGNVVGQVLNQVLGGGYGYNGYGANSQVAVNQCANAVQARLNGGYGGYGYGYGIWRRRPRARHQPVEPRSNGGLTVRGVASSGRYAGYGGNAPVDLTWKCKADYRGFVTRYRCQSRAVELRLRQQLHAVQQLRLFAVRLPPLLSAAAIVKRMRRGSKRLRRIQRYFTLGGPLPIRPP